MNASPATVPHRRLILILGALSALGPMAIDMYLPALPALQAHFGTTEAAAQQTLAAYFIGLSLGQLFYGPLSDGIGRKGPLLFGLGLFTLASLGCVFATGIEALIFLRLTQALGGCAGMVITRAIVRDCYPPQEMARILSTMMMIMGVAPVLAPLLGSMLFDVFGWRSIFITLVIYGLLCTLAVSLGVPETFKGTRQIPSLGAVLAGYLKLMRHRRFMGYALAGSVGQAGMFSYISASSFVFIEVFGVTPQHYAWLFGLNAFGLITASRLNAWALQRTPAQTVLRRALRSFFSFSLIMLVCAKTGFGGVYGVAMPLFFAISSLGFSFPNSTASAMAPFGDRAGMASALIGTLQFGLASLGSYAVGHLHDGTAVPMAATVTACAALALLFLHGLVRPPKEAPRMA